MTELTLTQKISTLEQALQEKTAALDTLKQYKMYFD